MLPNLRRLPIGILIWNIIGGVSPSEENARGFCLAGIVQVTQNLFVQLLHFNRNFSRRLIKHTKSTVCVKLILKNLLRDTQKIAVHDK